MPSKPATNSVVAEAQFQKIIADLPRHAALVKQRPYRQVWRFEYQQRGYYLKFYPRHGSFWKRLVRGNPASREFQRLQWLQKAELPAPRALATLVGMQLDGQKGDAVILEAIEPAQSLADLVNQALLNAQPLARRRELAIQFGLILQQLNLAGLGHHDLHLGNFLLKDQRLYLIDAYAVHRGGLSRADLQLLAHSAACIASRTDLLRFWWLLRPGAKLPRRNSRRQTLCRKFVSKTTQDNTYFGQFVSGQWSGYFFRKSPVPHRWSAASQMDISALNWQSTWPILWQQIERDELTIIKRTASGDVLSGEITLGQKQLAIVLKRPRRKYWHRYINEIGRGSRAMRAWKKSWALAIRHLPTAWPLLIMQRRRFGYAIESIIVYEKIAGSTLAQINLDELSEIDRQNLMRRSGALLRKMEHDGLFHWDAKAYNFMVQIDPQLGPQPILIDVDGIRGFQYTRFALHRLLKSMRDNPTFTPADSKYLCLGYAPWARPAPAPAPPD
ncbi:MAG: hypothetical protein IT448_05680 [Phycisphaerales bacterium]|nr:hypothetical protein [Phycisphaerales bacterium]